MEGGRDHGREVAQHGHDLGAEHLVDEGRHAVDVDGGAPVWSLACRAAAMRAAVIAGCLVAMVKCSTCTSMKPSE
jgi:hypothetical protein